MMRTMLRSPQDFQGSLDELYGQFVEPNLPAPETVSLYHRLLVEYCRSKDPLFLLRRMGAMEAGQIYPTATGYRVRATDNSPAWWIHYITFHDQRMSAETFNVAIEDAPALMFDASKKAPKSISKAGWYVAHIFPVKDRDVLYQGWGREELSRRFLRNIHPCNHFYVPKMKPQRYGEEPDVIAYFAGRYADRYSSVWTEFMKEVHGDVLRSSSRLGEMKIEVREEPTKDPPGGGPDIPARGAVDPPAVTYAYSRVCFLARSIEPLKDNEEFRMVTPFGTFQMSKAEFYRDFPKIAGSASYRIGRVYHRATPMREILPYRVFDLGL